MRTKIERTKRKQRLAKGQAISEAAAMLTTLFVFLAFPLMNLGSIALRTFFVISSAKFAAERACKSLSFQKAIALPPQLALANNVPAQTVGPASVQGYLQPFRGIHIQTVTVGYVIVNDATGAKTGPFYQPLPSYPVYGDTYYLDVNVIAQADPLIKEAGGAFATIPGLTTALTLSAHDSRVFENPKGLMN